MQHIVVLTARPTHLLANDWIINGVGRKGLYIIINSIVDYYYVDCKVILLNEKHSIIQNTY